MTVDRSVATSLTVLGHERPQPQPGDRRRGPRPGHVRLRRDKVDKAGRVTLRFAGTLRYLGIGRRWPGNRVVIVVSGSRSTVSLAATGEVIAVHEIDANIPYQRNLIDLIDWNSPDPEQT